MPPPACAVCEEEARGFIYSCSKCQLSLHIECATLKPSVKFGDHGHLLILFPDTRMQRFCEICGRQCNGFHVRCIECRINFHLHCHPSMPRIIKHGCHVDPLSFTELPVPDDFQPDDEFYCDVCETLRDPKDPVYYCAECDFVAHVECVISEVLPQIMEGASATEEMGDHILAGLDKQISQLRAWEETIKKLLESMEDARQYLEEKKRVMEEELERLAQFAEVINQYIEYQTRNLKELEDDRRKCIASPASDVKNKCPAMEDSGGKEDLSSSQSLRQADPRLRILVDIGRAIAIEGIKSLQAPKLS
ncbi:uncharacterized protein LOC110811449 [Carica papaya]|uniref:uncharacterized protein LOC110811449 n=1 Tax=Carica papaya TaxID=3649 RepID=UPI000B8CC37C|nr:uncharacterized protein LOC110811449 [Carica papaya]